MRKGVILCCLLACFRLGLSQDRTEYIEMYKDIAVSEMFRAGIPASIKLAQAIHESSCGKSDLACKANNHFGIKCGNDWNGKTYKKEDDDYEGGQLVKSCFREFRSVHDSYIAHSDFLTDPAKSKRYGFLFELDITDYKGWARGLSKSGYATDPQYANKIIDIVERYKLYELDSPSRRELASHAPKKSLGIDLVKYNNDIKYVIANPGDTPESIAAKNDMSARQVIRYNDDIDKEYQALEPGSIVYLQPKRTQNHGKQKVHLLKQDEDLIEVSQKYGIKLESLLKRNGLQPGDIPAPNQKILLKGKSKSNLRIIDPYDIPSEKPARIIPETEAVTSASTVPSVSTPSKSKEITYEKSEITFATSKPAATDHTVAKGDTLYSIARKYSMTLDELRNLNTLSSDTISIGQKLTVK